MSQQMPKYRLFGPEPKYSFRLLCKQCGSYQHTSIEQIPRPGMMYNMIRLHCRTCDSSTDVAEEMFGYVEQGQ
jgi:hypothetical protein